MQGLQNNARLLLSGGGSSESVATLDAVFVSEIEVTKPVLYVPVAMEAKRFSYAQCLEWFTGIYAPYGITNIQMCTDLNAAPDLGQFTAVFIGGGNTFKLLKEIKDAGFDTKLIEYLAQGGFLYGGSAGAIICGNSIEAAYYGDSSDVNDVGLEDLTGLNLLGGMDVWCHYTPKDDEQIVKYAADLYILYEESGLFMHGSGITGIGKPFLRKADISFSDE